MARNLLYHLNRLQDVLSLPRTATASYPVDTDPLHSDTILTEDIWEASKTVTGDLSRRGVMDVISTATPIVKGQNAYTLPSNICKLLSIEYFDGTYWKGPLTSISYDDYVRISAAKTDGTPTYYTHTLSDSREVYLTISSGITESSFRDAGPLTLKSAAQLTVTSSGSQINKGDLVFNVTQDSGGLVEYLDMSTTKFTSGDPSTNDIDIDRTANTIKISDTGIDSSNYTSKAAVGDIYLEGKTWVVITKVTNIGNVLVIHHDGVIRGELSAFTIDNGAGVKIGSPDRLIVQSDNALILDANQGMSGGSSDLVSTYTTNVSNPAITITHNATLVYDVTIANDQADVDLSAYASLGYTLVIYTSDETYTGYIQGVTVSTVGGYKQSVLSLTSSAPSNGVGGSIDSSHIANTGLISNITSVSITKPPFFVGDVVQIESQFATLDTIQLYPYPDRADTTGVEGLRMTYVPYPVQPTKPDQVIELPETFNDSILAKAHEYAMRRETSRVEPYDISIRRATSTARPVPNNGLMRNRRGVGNQVINFVVPS